MQLKLQSAMEYLMTYGWAILIIAVVLAALFQLGVFNPNTFAPKAPPGSCQVIRPYGSGNTNYISLAGTCSNQLPQYVAQFNGGSSYIDLGNPSYLPSGNSARTVCTWGRLYAAPTNYKWLVSYGTNAAGEAFFIGVTPASALDIGAYTSDFWVNGFWTSRLNAWQFICATYGGTTVSAYAAGTLIGSGTYSWNTVLNYFRIGGQVNTPSQFWNGQISNVQIYNTTLSANDITALYNEGIGGAPIDLFHLVGWWPLNGNANDYSGNLNNGVSTGISYSSSWASTYVAP